MMDLAPIRARLVLLTTETCTHKSDVAVCPFCPEDAREKWRHDLAEFRYHARTDVPALCSRVEELERALRHLLDDWERSQAGFHQHIELRYAVRDAARAALRKP